MTASDFKVSYWRVALRWDDPPHGQAPLEAYGAGSTPEEALSTAQENAKIEVLRMEDRVAKLKRVPRYPETTSIDDIASLLR